MRNKITWETIMLPNGVWECYTFDMEDGAINYEDYTGIGMTAGEAHTDWLESNNIEEVASIGYRYKG